MLEPERTAKLRGLDWEHGKIAIRSVVGVGGVAAEGSQGPDRGAPQQGEVLLLAVGSP